jgi:hypothetical protein
MAEINRPRTGGLVTADAQRVGQSLRPSVLRAIIQAASALAPEVEG